MTLYREPPPLTLDQLMALIEAEPRSEEMFSMACSRFGLRMSYRNPFNAGRTFFWGRPIPTEVLEALADVEEMKDRKVYLSHVPTSYPFCYDLQVYDIPTYRPRQDEASGFALLIPLAVIFSPPLFAILAWVWGGR